jgi:hypothetical protein
MIQATRSLPRVSYRQPIARAVAHYLSTAGKNCVGPDPEAGHGAEAPVGYGPVRHAHLPGLSLKPVRESLGEVLLDRLNGPVEDQSRIGGPLPPRDDDASLSVADLVLARHGCGRRSHEAGRAGEPRSGRLRPAPQRAPGEAGYEIAQPLARSNAGAQPGQETALLLLTRSAVRGQIGHAVSARRPIAGGAPVAIRQTRPMSRHRHTPAFGPRTRTHRHS